MSRVDIFHYTFSVLFNRCVHINECRRNLVQITNTVSVHSLNFILYRIWNRAVGKEEKVTNFFFRYSSKRESCVSWSNSIQCVLSAECGPGFYKGMVSTTNEYCYPFGFRLACVPCTGNKIKSVSGDNSTLCQDVCDGTTNVPNIPRTACGE